MPLEEKLAVELKIDQDKNIAYIKIKGSVTSKQVLNAFDTAVSDPQYKKGMARLWDFTEADLSAIDSDTIFQMAQYSLRFPPGINDVKVAFVTSRPLEYGLARMFEMTSRAKTPISVFESIDEAQKWMMQPEDKNQPQ